LEECFRNVEKVVAMGLQLMALPQCGQVVELLRLFRISSANPDKRIPAGKENIPILKRATAASRTLLTGVTGYTPS